MNNLSQILSLKYHIYGKGKYKDQKDSIKYRFFLSFHFLRFLKYSFLQHFSGFHTFYEFAIVYLLYHTLTFLHIINYENIRYCERSEQ